MNTQHLPAACEHTHSLNSIHSQWFIYVPAGDEAHGSRTLPPAQPPGARTKQVPRTAEADSSTEPHQRSARGALGARSMEEPTFREDPVRQL
jgi:hypothetical protein